MKAFVVAPLALAAALASAPAQSNTSKGSPSSHLHYVVAPEGNEARYRVREQLLGFDLPNDAVGATKDITGRIVVQRDGAVVKDSSKIVVRLTSLKSDKSRRDLYLQDHTLETAKFPQVEFVPSAFDGLASAVSAGSAETFSVVGDLTVRGVTHPTTWHVTARSEDNDIVGSAATAFTFKDFAIEQPHVPFVLAVEDTIKLEYDFRFAPEQTP